ncbi:hypothetical protein FHS07_002280 [Microbacterium proteolyticum]|uniref:Uncharacterized protein n=1 Tax=Microbacterium proteolyticum TaxID=1572644 RepID=A0A7W5CKH7_9MICO|nr:hypothetical protein [Microbacterium proteolyticum]MBB3158584.1 hypothetical protein [Microbacterium proteolyticum]
MTYLAGDTPQPTRRHLVSAAAWAVPAIAVVAATPAHASSGGSVLVAKIRPGSDFTAQNLHQYDGATNTNRGPIAVYVRARYDQNIVWWPQSDPAVAVIPYAVAVEGPLGPSSMTGVLSIAIGGYAQDVRTYPTDGVHPVPTGTYRFTLVLFGSDGSATATTSVEIS